MNESPPAAALERALRRWRRLAIASSLAACFCVALLAVTAVLATEPLGTRHNLYYLLWKAGLRPYERSVAWGGLLHDHEHRQQLIGMPLEQFQRTFPDTFHKVRKAPPNAKPNQEYYVDDYAQAQDEDGGIYLCWLAVFEKGRLIACDLAKG